MSDVQLREICQSFGGTDVLDEIDLSVESGDYVVLLGRSGCGKTTTLKVIAGLQRHRRGSVLIGGRCVDDQPPRDRDVSMVFQNDTLYPHLTVRQSIGFGLRKRLSAEELRGRIERAAELAGASEFLDRYPANLSGGELRRGAIAKSIARQASVRLMDEPMSALDAPLRHALQEDLLRWHQSIAGTTIHVTHDGQEAMRMADRIAVMERGRIVQYATPAEIYAKPLTRSVAQSIGSPPINLLAPDTDDLSIRMPADRRLENMEIGIRPEALRLVMSDRGDRAPRPHEISLSGRIERIARTGGAVELTVSAGRSRVVALIGLDKNAEPGQMCTLVAESHDVHFFDREGGQRVAADAGR